MAKSPQPRAPSSTRSRIWAGFLVGRERPDVERHLAARPHRLERLGVAGLVVSDDVVAEADDARGRAVVGVERDDAGAGKGVPEPEDIFAPGAAEPIDRLVVVADGHQVGALAREQADQLVLQPARILELVDHDEAEALLQRAQQGGTLGQQPMRPEQDVVEVHAALALLPLLEAQQQPLEVALRLARFRQLAERAQAQLGLGQRGERRLRLQPVGDAELAQHALEHDDGKRAAAENFLAIALAAQQLQEERVERAGGYRFGGRRRDAGQGGDPVLHFLGGLDGKGDEQNRTRIGSALRDQIAGAGGEHARLAGAGSGERQQRSGAVADGLDLRAVQEQAAALERAEIAAVGIVVRHEAAAVLSGGERGCGQAAAGRSERFFERQRQIGAHGACLSCCTRRLPRGGMPVRRSFQHNGSRSRWQTPTGGRGLREERCL